MQAYTTEEDTSAVDLNEGVQKEILNRGPQLQLRLWTGNQVIGRVRVPFVYSRSLGTKQFPFE